MRKINSKFIHGNNVICRGHNTGGTIINIIVVIVFFGLIGAGIMWVIKQTGQAGEEYTRGMINTTNKATVVACQSNLRNIWTVIQMYSMSNDELPKSFEELVDEVGDSRIFRCPEPNSPRYEYIPGQTLDSPGENILVYEPLPVHGGMCNVLRVSGKMDLITQDELQAALEQTKTHLRK